MSDAREYVALVDFSLNLDNGKGEAINVKAGDPIMFDGLYAECRGGKGQARVLSKVIGEWIQPVGDEAVATPVAEPTVSRNATAGRVIENSSPDQDPSVLAMQRRQASGTPVEAARPVSTGRVIESSSADQDPAVRAQQQRKAPQVINSDETEVAKASVPSQSSNNVAGVSIGEDGIRKTATVSREQSVVKKTAYVETKGEEAEYKHLKVDMDASGVEVAKVKAPAITRGEARSSTATHMEVSQEEGVAKETTYEKSKPTVVGSSTQASVEMTRTGAPKRQVISDSPQDAKVVGKVSKIKEADVVSADGFRAKLTVGAATVDDLEMSEVTFSGANEPVTDLNVVPQDEGDINVDDILKEL